jgi:hypothetical protein
MGKPLLHQKSNNNIVSEFIKTNPELISIDSLAFSASLTMVSEKLNELLSPPISDEPLPKTLRDAPAADCTIQALRHFHEGPAFSSDSPDLVRIVMGKMVQLAFEVSSLTLSNLIYTPTRNHIQLALTRY